VPPGVGEALPKASDERDKTSDEDGVSTTESLVEWVSEPTTDSEAAEVRCRVDKSLDPFVVFDAKFRKEVQIRYILD